MGLQSRIGLIGTRRECVRDVTRELSSASSPDPSEMSKTVGQLRLSKLRHEHFSLAKMFAVLPCPDVGRVSAHHLTNVCLSLMVERRANHADHIWVQMSSQLPCQHCLCPLQTWTEIQVVPVDEWTSEELT